MINEGCLRARGLRYIKQFPAEERRRLEQLCYNVFSHLPPAPEPHYGDDFVINMLQSDAVVNVKADVLQLYTKKVAEYSSMYNKEPSRETRRKFMVSSWTQYAVTHHLTNI